MIGLVIDNFEVREEIGRGGMGVIYRGHDRSLNRPVAIKVLSFHLKAVSPAGTAASSPDIQTGVTETDNYRFIPGTRRLVVLQGDVPAQNFWLIDFDTGARRRLTDLQPGSRIKSFDISPDGKQILFDRWKENSDIVLIERQASFATVPSEPHR